MDGELFGIPAFLKPVISYSLQELLTLEVSYLNLLYLKIFLAVFDCFQAKA